MMDTDRRHFLLMAGAIAVTSATRRFATATEAASGLRLDAQPVDPSPNGADDRTSPLSYRTPAATPILRIARGEILRVHLTNASDEATSIDWHGLRAAPTSVTRPDLLAPETPPGGETSIDLTPVESGTAWFHPPFLPGRSNQTARGLAGVLIVEEARPPVVDDDLVLFLSEAVAPPGTRLSDRLSINRQGWPVTRTYPPGSRLRLRLVNGSTRSAVAAIFEGGRPMVIAIDGQPSELFQPLDDMLPVGPGARFDLLVDLPRHPGEDFRLRLRDMAGDPASGPPAFVAHPEGEAKGTTPPIVALDPNPALPREIPLEKATRVEIHVQKGVGGPSGAVAFAINGAASIALPKAPLFTARRKTAVTIGITNRTAELIGLRPHGQAMRPLHPLDDGWEPYWRDSILVPPGKTVHVAFWADMPGRWLIESPFFDQATTGLRRWFEIL